MRIARRHVVLLSSLVLFGAACGRSRQELPPARGDGAPPLPDLPARGGSDQATAVSTSEGHTTGTTYPRAEAQIGPNGPGVIAKIMVKEGDRVRKGMVLFKQDTREAVLRVAQAQAALEAARVNLRASETEFQRTNAMYEQKAMNQMQWDQAKARADSARVAVQQAEVALSMARKQLDDATVRSSINGVVTSKLKSEGEMATMMPPTIVLVVQDQSVLELRFRLPERAMSELRIGDGVLATFDALGIKREAKIVRIQPAVDMRTRTVEAVAEIPNKDGALKSGLLATVRVPSKDRAANGAAAAAAPKTASRGDSPRSEDAP